MAKVFVSYSRKDIAFAKRLTGELQKGELDFWIDWEGIPPTVDWWREIEKGVEEADAFLFLISPDSTKSKVCLQEIDTAVKNGKRIIPIVVREIEWQDTPPQLGHLNYIFFSRDDDFDTAVKKLMTAIQTDYEWAATHRRLQVKGLEWERNNKERSYLLRGKDLLDAETNLARNTSKDPHPTDLQREYVFASRKATDREKRITTGISVIGVVLLAILAVFGFVQAGLATENAQLSQQNAAAAQTAQAEAEAQASAAKAAQANAERETRRATAGKLALESKSFLDTYPQRALLLALEAVRVNQAANEPTLSEAEEALRLAHERISGTGLNGFQYIVDFIQFTNSTDEAMKETGQWLIAASTIGEEARIWNVDSMVNNPEYKPFSVAFPSVIEQPDGTQLYSSIYVSPQQSWLVVDTHNDTRLWKIAVSDENRTQITFEGSAQFVDPKNDNLVLENQKERSVLWELDPQTLTREEVFSLEGSFVTISPDHRYFITQNPEKGLFLWNATTPDKVTLLPIDQSLDFQTILISPNDEWIILMEDITHPDIQVPVWTIGEGASYQTGTAPWVSTSIILLPLSITSTQPLRFDLEDHVRPESLQFSPAGSKLAYLAGSKPDANGETVERTGILDFQNQIPDNRLLDDPSYGVTWINENWIFNSYNSTFLNLREYVLVQFDIPEVQFSPDLDINGYAKFDETGKYLLGGKERVDFEKLDKEHAASLEPISQASNPGNVITPNNLAELVISQPQLAGMEDSVNVAATSPGGQWFVAGARDGSLRYWNLNQPAEASRLQLDHQTDYIALSNDARWLAEGPLLWRLEDGKPTQSYLVENTIPNALSYFGAIGTFSPDSHWYIGLYHAGNGNFEVKLVDLTSLESSSTFHVEKINLKDDPYATIKFSPDSQWAVILGQTNSFAIALDHRNTYPLPVSSFPDVTFTPDQKNLILIQSKFDEQQNVTLYQNPQVWSLPTDQNSKFEKVGEINIEDGIPYLSRNGHWLIALPQSSSFSQLPGDGKLWDVNCVVQKYECVPHILSAHLVAFSPNSRFLVVGSQKTESPDQPLDFEIWDLQPWAQDKNDGPAKIYSGQTNQGGQVTISRDGNHILLGKNLLDFIHPSGLFAQWNNTFFPRNQTGFDGTAYLSQGYGGGGGGEIGSFQTDHWVDALIQGASTPQFISLRGHESNVSHTQISPNEKFVLTYSGWTADNGGLPERKLRLWDMDKLRQDPLTPAVTLPISLDENNQIEELAFSPDNNWIYLIDTNNVLHYFPTSVNTLEKQACAAVGRNFIINEWERFFPHETYRKTCDNLPIHPSVNPRP